MRTIIFYTHVCAPCHDTEYHYYEILNLIKQHKLMIDERFTGAVESWRQQAELFAQPLPILYSPDKDSYISTYPFDKKKIDEFLAFVAN